LACVTLMSIRSGSSTSPSSCALSCAAASTTPSFSTLSLHDALPIFFTDIDDTLTRDGAIEPAALAALHRLRAASLPVFAITGRPDRKSTRLNSSHVKISYAVFCLKKKMSNTLTVEVNQMPIDRVYAA